MIRNACYKEGEAALLFLERIPAPPLTEFVRSLWYARVPETQHARERVLPSGCVQVIINLARGFLLDCPEGHPHLKRPPALVVGARSVYEIVDTSDMADLIGIVFEPGGFAPFAGDACDLFSNRSIALEDIWGNGADVLRNRLLEAASPHDRIGCLEDF